MQAQLLIVATQAQCNKRKRTTTPAKGKGKEGNTVRESREWSDDSDVEKPRRHFAAYEEAPPRPNPKCTCAWAVGPRITQPN